MVNYNRETWRPETPPAPSRDGFTPLPGFEETAVDPVDAALFLSPEGLDTIAEAVSIGIGVLLSLTSDGGALSVTVYLGDTRHRVYATDPHSADRLWAALRAIIKLRRTTPPVHPPNTPGTAHRASMEDQKERSRRSARTGPPTP
jgi:hypothetical protein